MEHLDFCQVCLCHLLNNKSFSIFVMLYKVVLSFESVDEIVKYDMH